MDEYAISAGIIKICNRLDPAAEGVQIFILKDGHGYGQKMPDLIPTQERGSLLDNTRLLYKAIVLTVSAPANINPVGPCTTVPLGFADDFEPDIDDIGDDNDYYDDDDD